MPPAAARRVSRYAAQFHLSVRGELLAGAIGYLAKAIKFVVPILGPSVSGGMAVASWAGRLVNAMLTRVAVDLTPDEATKEA